MAIISSYAVDNIIFGMFSTKILTNASLRLQLNLQLKAETAQTDWHCSSSWFKNNF